MGALERIEAAGFRVILTGDTSDTVDVFPDELLTPKQRAWVQAHQGELANEARKQLVLRLWDGIDDLLDERKELHTKIGELNYRLSLYIQLANMKTHNQSPKPFADDELRSLRRLCHPDKHGGSEAATRLTQKLNAMLSG